MPIIHAFKSEYSFLAMDYPCRIDYHGDLYPTLQHAFLAAMATNSKDKQYVRRNSSPTEALKRSRKIERRSDWEAVESTFLYLLSKIKFAPGCKQDQVRARLQAGAKAPGDRRCRARRGERV